MPGVFGHLHRTAVFIGQQIGGIVVGAIVVHQFQISGEFVIQPQACFLIL